MKLEEAFLQGALAVQRRLQETLDAEEKAMQTALADAIRDGSHLPDAYWQRRHFAEQKLHAVNEIVEALRK